jgi:LPXTG-site transpeptidase (sortase) family protein
MARKKGVINEIRERSGAFATTFLFLFALTVGFLFIMGDTPDDSSSSDTQTATNPTNPTNPTPTTDTQPTQPTQPAIQQAGEYPVRIVAKAVSLDAHIVNPTSTNVNSLDQELTKGAVRYPTSGMLGQNGTVLLFGHSSYLPVVYHQYYKTFDGIQNLKSGAIVSVYSNDRVYNFAVTGVRVADANDTGSDIVELPTDNQYLTLITCDSFATKSNRFIVTATLQSSNAI